MYLLTNTPQKVFLTISGGLQSVKSIHILPNLYSKWDLIQQFFLHSLLSEHSSSLLDSCYSPVYTFNRESHKMTIFRYQMLKNLSTATVIDTIHVYFLAETINHRSIGLSNLRKSFSFLMNQQFLYTVFFLSEREITN